MAPIDKRLGQSLIRTLEFPQDEKAFISFFEICHRKLVKYLRYLKARGWRLPNIGAHDINSYEDLALDILGPLMAKHNRRHLAKVREYFVGKGITNPGDSDPETIADLFMILLRKHCRQELFWIAGAENPEIAKLKRRFKDILTGPGYIISSPSGKMRRVVSLDSSATGAGLESKLLPADRIDALVRNSLRATTSDVELCSMVFNLACESTGRSTSFYYNELLSALIKVRVEFAEEGLASFAPPSTPRDEYILTAAREALGQALKASSNSVLETFIDKGRITRTEAELLSEACFQHFSELIETGTSNSLPQCIREAMPPETHSLYMSKYKYILDTVVSDVRANLRNELRNISTNLDIVN